MSCESNNATPPGPAIAPGVEGVDPARVARDVGSGRWAWGASAAPGRVDPRIASWIPSFDAPFFQAGLAGYSDAAMRIVARRHGCPMCVTEALLDRTLLAGGRGFAKADLGELHDNIPGGREDTPLVGQIMGSDPAEMAAAALKMIEQGKRTEKEYRKLAYRGALAPGQEAALRLPGGEQVRWEPEEVVCGEEEGIEAHDTGAGGTEASSDELPFPSSLRPSVAPSLQFASIDVNLACPVKKISTKARGGHWLAEPTGAIAILKAVRDAVPAEVACSVKLRRSFDDTPEMARNFDRILAGVVDLGYAFATVHARTVQQKYVGPSRWDLLREIVRRHPKAVVLGSGDVWEAADIFRMIGYAGVSGVSVARGCIGNPWIFRQARDLMAGRDPRPPTLAEQRGVLDEHFRLLLAVNRGMRHGEFQSAKLIRKFGIRFSAHHPRGEEVRLRMIKVNSLADWEAVLSEYY